MDTEHPKMLYRFPATGTNSMHLEGSTFDTQVVDDADAETAALNDGWFTTWPAAKQAHAAAQEAAAAAQAASDATTLPTRAELEQKATELGIQFTAKTSDKKLNDLIAATLEP